MATPGPEIALDERYCSSCGELRKSDTKFCVHCGVRNRSIASPGAPGQSAARRSPDPQVGRRPKRRSVNGRDKNVALVLVFFLGGLGIHKFYLGQPVQGIFYLLFFWTLIPSVIVLVEFFYFLFTPEEEFRARYPYV